MKDNKNPCRNQRTLWTVREINFLEKHYDKMPVAETGRLLGRSVAAVKIMAQKLECCRKKAPDWTEDEKEVLRSIYPSIPDIRQICTMLPGRSLDAIVLKARKMRIMRPEPFWLQHEIDVLYAHYPLEGKKTAERLPGRSGEAVKLKANELGIKFLGEQTYRVWSEDEWALLEKNHLLPFAELCRLFPGRSKSSVETARSRFRKRQLSLK